MSEHTEEWRLVAASTTAPDPDRFLVPSTPSRDAQLLTAEFCAACPGARLCRQVQQVGISCRSILRELS